MSRPLTIDERIQELEAVVIMLVRWQQWRLDRIAGKR